MARGRCESRPRRRPFAGKTERSLEGAFRLPLTDPPPPTRPGPMRALPESSSSAPRGPSRRSAARLRRCRRALRRAPADGQSPHQSHAGHRAGRGRAPPPARLAVGPPTDRRIGACAAAASTSDRAVACRVSCSPCAPRAAVAARGLGAEEGRSAARLRLRSRDRQRRGRCGTRGGPRPGPRPSRVPRPGGGAGLRDAPRSRGVRVAAARDRRDARGVEGPALRRRAARR